MKKFVIFLFFLAIFYFISFIKPNLASAAESCSASDINITISVSPSTAYTLDGLITATFTVIVSGSTHIDLDYQYFIALESGVDVDRNSASQKLIVGTSTFKIDIPQNTNANWHIRLKQLDYGPIVICQDGDYRAVKKTDFPHCHDDVKNADETGTCLDPEGDPGCCDCGGTECIACTTCPAAPPAPPGGGAGSGTGTCTPIGFSGTGVETALGCIPTDPAELVKWILKYAILMGGGIAFLLSVFGGVSIILAGGNPEKINAGKEIIGSALTGLLFIIFSVFLLRFIGYDILQLPGFANP